MAACMHIFFEEEPRPQQPVGWVEGSYTSFVVGHLMYARAGFETIQSALSMDEVCMTLATCSTAVEQVLS